MGGWLLRWLTWVVGWLLGYLGGCLATWVAGWLVRWLPVALVVARGPSFAYRAHILCPPQHRGVPRVYAYMHGLPYVHVPALRACACLTCMHACCSFLCLVCLPACCSLCASCACMRACLTMCPTMHARAPPCAWTCRCRDVLLLDERVLELQLLVSAGGGGGGGSRGGGGLLPCAATAAGAHWHVPLVGLAWDRLGLACACQ